MEQYFEITKESVHYEQQLTYEEDFHKEKSAVKNFMSDYEVKGSGYMLYQGYFWVTDNSENRERFAGQIRKETLNGCISFKKASKVGKAFTDRNIKKAQKPFVPFFFDDCYGTTKTRIFSVNGKVYCSIEQTDDAERLQCPKGFIEIKASEFYKIIEDNG